MTRTCVAPGFTATTSGKPSSPEIAAEKAIVGAQTGPTPPAPKPPRIRRPSLESQVQLLKAARVAGVQIAVTIKGDKVTATPVRGSSPANREDPTRGSPPADAAPGRALFKVRAVPKVKVVL